MVEFRESSVVDDTAHALLTEYFLSRAATFPPSQGAYQTTFPSAEQFVPPRGVFLLVEDTDSGDGHSAVGCGGIRRLDVPPRPNAVCYEIKHLWLQPVTRGRGYGRALLAELEIRARSFGATELVLDTNASLAAAGGLYRSSGFIEVAPYNNNPNATTWYAKSLAEGN